MFKSGDVFVLRTEPYEKDITAIRIVEIVEKHNDMRCWRFDYKNKPCEEIKEGELLKWLFSENEWKSSNKWNDEDTINQYYNKIEMPVEEISTGIELNRLQRVEY